MLRDARGFTLIELMIVVVVVGILAAIGMANYMSMQNRARVTQVRSTMHTVQLTVEDFSSRNNGSYPANAASTTVEGAFTLTALMPGGALPTNPFTLAMTNLDWSNVLGTAPTTDPAGGVSLNVTQSIPGGAYDLYDILGTDDVGTIAQVVKNY
jgi:prepilin-type N-terminal cleavage/methylation domain-containing protein